MNAIEHNTRYASQYLGERADGGIIQQLFKMGDNIAFGPGVKATENLRDIVKDWAPKVLGDLDNIVGFGPYIVSIKEVLEDTRNITADIRDTVKQEAQAINVAVTANGVTKETATDLANRIAEQMAQQLAGVTLR